MTAHPIVFKGAQIGLQSGLGTGVAADIRLLTPGFSRVMPKSSGGYMHTAPGNRMPTAALPPGMFWSEVSFQGPMTYNDMTTMLAAGFGLPTPTPDGTNGFAWEFALLLNSALAPQFLTYENGNADRAERAINAFVNSYQFSVSRALTAATQSYSGTMLAGKKEPAVTITPTPSQSNSKIIRVQDFDFYAADSKAALDTAVSTDAKFPIPLSVVLTIPELAEPMGRINSDENSFFARIEKALIPTLALKTTDDTDFDTLVGILDTGAAKFFALRALGDVIAGASPSQEECRFDFCGAVTEPETPDEETSAATNTLTFQNKFDATWDQSLNIKLVDRKSVV